MREASRSRRKLWGRSIQLEAQQEYPEAGVLYYNLACAEAQLGESDAALEHLTRSVALEDRFAAYARDDEDLASIRADTRFPAETPA